jgi:RNA ligase (TIGR02306 family)
MSEFHVVVVKVGTIEKHPNADTLSITKCEGYPVVFRTGDFNTGDLAIYVPENAVVPDTKAFHFLAPKALNENGEQTNELVPVGQVKEKYRRIRAKKLRGLYSEGLLTAYPKGWAAPQGTEVAALMGVTKYEEPAEKMTGGPNKASAGRQEKGPKHFKFGEYTDLEPLRKYHHLLVIDEPVVITEKIHGMNARFVHDGKRLWVGSHHQLKAHPNPRRNALEKIYDFITKLFKRTVVTPKNQWWKQAEKYDMENKLSNFPMIVFFGEVYGRGIQKLAYDTDASLRIFDTFDVVRGEYNDWETTKLMATAAGLDTVPELYVGPWRGYDVHEKMAEGNSTLANHIREGFVVKPKIERRDPHFGRVALKLVGQNYKLRKE